MNENSCSEILDKAISECHIEEASDAEAFFKARKSVILRRNRILKSVSVFAACITLVLSLSVAAMFTNPDKKSEDLNEGALDYGNGIYERPGDSYADDEAADNNGSYDSSCGDNINNGEETAQPYGVFELNIGSFKGDTDTDILPEILTKESKASSVTLTSKQISNLENQLKAYLKNFRAANSLSDDYTIEIPSQGRESDTQIFVRVLVSVTDSSQRNHTVEFLIVSEK